MRDEIREYILDGMVGLTVILLVWFMLVSMVYSLLWAAFDYEPEMFVHIFFVSPGIALWVGLLWAVAVGLIKTAMNL